MQRFHFLTPSQDAVVEDLGAPGEDELGLPDELHALREHPEEDCEPQVVQGDGDRQAQRLQRHDSDAGCSGPGNRRVVGYPTPLTREKFTALALRCFALEIFWKLHLVWGLPSWRWSPVRTSSPGFPTPPLLSKWKCARSKHNF